MHGLQGAVESDTRCAVLEAAAEVAAAAHTGSLETVESDEFAVAVAL